MSSEKSDPVGELPRLSSEDAEAVRVFANDMMRKLRANAHKAHWSTVSNQWLLSRMVRESAELHDALAAWEASGQSSSAALHVINECADVANFAMMIAHNVARDAESALADEVTR